MDKVEIFSVPNITFSDGTEFREYLVRNYDASQVDHELTIIVGITKHPSNIEFFEALQSFGFSVKRTLGSVYHMEYNLEEGALECYVTHDNETGVVVFYTNFRKTEEIPKIRDFLKFDKNTYYLFFKPLLMKQISEKLMENYQDLEIHEFTARRSPRSRFEARIRPEYRRTISYWGDDGRETLQELEYQYGVLPRKFVVNIPGIIKFKIDEEGLFTFFHGDLRILFEILGKAVNESRKTMEAYNGSSFRVLPIKTAHRLFKIPSSTPVSIHLRNPIAFHEMDELKELLEAEQYSIVDFVAQEGSLFLSTDVVSKSGYQFRIKASENHIKMFPIGDKNFAEFMQFYEFILQSVDPRAELA
ncbi:MAG: hypothetical protein OIN88_00925 [Candidatus Methanoperedens sp.]|nr:hypothetical protein [Candidatus Methanoperedens sp.]MCZ7360298.1 hypothetical protein [Candidatus Methanoperedens sp.]HLB69912.1 hypothetical protein [Candidatus Methanoperedens sp.]